MQKQRSQAVQGQACISRRPQPSPAIPTRERRGARAQRSTGAAHRSAEVPQWRRRASYRFGQGAARAVDRDVLFRSSTSHISSSERIRKGTPDDCTFPLRPRPRARWDWQREVSSRPRTSPPPTFSTALPSFGSNHRLPPPPPAFLSFGRPIHALLCHKPSSSIPGRNTHVP